MMSPSHELTMKNIRPLFGRATIIESSVDQAERDSGLIVPLVHDEDDGIRRGVIVDVDLQPLGGAGLPDRFEEILTRGRVVYFREALRIGDVLIVDILKILAYEAEEEQDRPCGD